MYRPPPAARRPRVAQSILFMKITEQMIVNCRKYVNKEGNLWDQPSEALIAQVPTSGASRRIRRAAGTAMAARAHMAGRAACQGRGGARSRCCVARHLPHSTRAPLLPLLPPLPPCPHGTAPATPTLSVRPSPPQLKSCVKLYDCYRADYERAKESLAEKPAGKQFDFNENVIFGKVGQRSGSEARVLWRRGRTTAEE